MATLLEQVDVVGTVEDALRTHALGRAVLPAEAHLRWDLDDGWARSLTLPAALGTPAYASGIKVINGNIGNPSRGIPRASGLILLFDIDTGQVTTIMAAAQVSAMRTAAVSVAAMKRLAPRPVERALVVGAGPIGEAHVRMLGRAVASVQTIWSADLNAARSMALADQVEGVTAVEDWRSVVASADVVIGATTSTEPYLRLGDIGPGTLVVNVGLDDCAADLLLGPDLLVVDSWELVANDSNRLLGRLIGAGLVAAPGGGTEAGGRPRVAAELGHIIAGTTKLELDPRDRVVVNPFGMAVSDIAVATAVDRLAAGGDAGQRLRR